MPKNTDGLVKFLQSHSLVPDGPEDQSVNRVSNVVWPMLTLLKLPLSARVRGSHQHAG